MLTVPWDPFLMKILLRKEVTGSVNNAQTHWKSHHSYSASHTKKQKNKKKAPTRTLNNHYPNGYLILIISGSINLPKPKWKNWVLITGILTRFSSISFWFIPDLTIFNVCLYTKIMGKRPTIHNTTANAPLTTNLLSIRRTKRVVLQLEFTLGGFNLPGLGYLE